MNQLAAPDLPPDQQISLNNINNRIANDNVFVDICELGYCVKAKRPFIKGEFIYRFSGPTISFAETTRRGEMECMAFQYDHDKYADTEMPGIFVNHSCEPNTGIRNSFDLIAIEDIDAGTELKFDYSTTMDEDHFTMPCKCGKPRCRGIVRDFKLLPASLREKYLDMDIVSVFIRSQYR